MKLGLGSFNEKVIKLRIEDLIPDANQPRKTFESEAIKELAQSLAETGQISPIVVKPGNNKKYMIIVGERRWRAAKEAGLKYVDCIVKRNTNNQKIVEMQLAENYQRKDLSPLEHGGAIYSFMQKYPISQSELSKRTGIPQRTISARLALYSLPSSMHAKIEAGEIGPYQALEISKLPAEKQEYIAREIAAHRLRGRKLEELVKQLKKNPEMQLMTTTQGQRMKSKFLKPYKIKVFSTIKSIKVNVVQVFDLTTASGHNYQLNYQCACGMKCAILAQVKCNNCSGVSGWYVVGSPPMNQ